MKQLPIFIGIFILFYTTACSKPKSTIKLSFSKSIGGGNPEVLNHCFGLKKVAKRLCFDHFFPNNSNILIHSNQGEAIMLAGRGEHVEKRELQLHKNDDKVLLYLDISNVKTPLSSNIKTTIFTYDKNSVVVNINTDEIKEKIVLKDKDGNVVLKYHIK